MVSYHVGGHKGPPCSGLVLIQAKNKGSVRDHHISGSFYHELQRSEFKSCHSSQLYKMAESDTTTSSFEVIGLLMLPAGESQHWSIHVNLVT